MADRRWPNWLYSLLSLFNLRNIIIVAVMARLLAALALGNIVAELPGIFDQISYHNLALRLRDGYGFTFDQLWWPITPAGEPTAHWSYLYTFYLTGIYSLVGAQPLVARLLQALAGGILMPWLTYRLGRRAFGETVGLLSAAWAAVYGYFIYYAAALMTETFFIIGILWVFDATLRLSDHEDRPPLSLLLELGVALGVTILLRQLFMLFVPFLFLWLLWQRMGSQSFLPALSSVVFAGLAVTVVLVLMIGPFTLFNYHQFNHFTLLNTNSGYAFFWGNHPIYGTKFVPILTFDMGTYQGLIPEELRHLNEAELDSALLQRGLQFIIDDPGRYLLLSLSRIPPYFMFWPSGDSSLPSNIVRVASFGVALPFMLLGLALWLVASLKEGWQAMLRSAPGLYLLFMLVFTGIHVLTWTLVRYRLPVDAFGLMFAAYGLNWLLGRLPLQQPVPAEAV